MSVSFCLPHPVAVSAFMICRGLCACTEMLWMCVLYVSFGSKVRPRTFGCVAMGSALLFIWSTLLYGCETWTISGDMIKKLEALETWFYRRMLSISWKEKVTNVEVYRRMNTSTSLLIDIVHRQLTFLGHILRKGELENLGVTGFVDGNRDRGRQRETFLTYLSKIVGQSPLDLINLAKKRDVWMKFCAHSNLHLRI